MRDLNNIASDWILYQHMNDGSTECWMNGIEARDRLLNDTPMLIERIKCLEETIDGIIAKIDNSLKLFPELTWRNDIE